MPANLEIGRFYIDDGGGGDDDNGHPVRVTLHSSRKLVVHLVRCTAAVA